MCRGCLASTALQPGVVSDDQRQLKTSFPDARDQPHRACLDVESDQRHRGCEPRPGRGKTSKSGKSPSRPDATAERRRPRPNVNQTDASDSRTPLGDPRFPKLVLMGLTLFPGDVIADSVQARKKRVAADSHAIQGPLDLGSVLFRNDDPPPVGLVLRDPASRSTTARRVRSATAATPRRRQARSRSTTWPRRGRGMREKGMRRESQMLKVES
jgi:hypothetical protein